VWSAPDWGGRDGGATARTAPTGGKGREQLPARVSDDVVAEVKRAADIVDIVSRYVTLKKAGKTFKACCPFHAEKTPSFIVNPERQMFKCFGCGKAGDVFSFVGEHERVDFLEAVRIVAGAVGVALPERWDRRRGGSGASQEVKGRLYELHAWAARFFAKQFAEAPEGARAREYMAKRGFARDTLEGWSIGYAPESWDALGRAARAAGYTDKELAASGLVVPREGGNGHYDRFRNRVMFPIADVQGRVIAFGARALAEGEVKYINSPETPLFSKSRCLYGLDKAKQAAIDGHRIMITEGYTDTLMCHQCGVPWAVATLGTALTRDHITLIRRYAERVILLFDADAAGEAAVDRSLEVFADADLDVRVPALKAGMDPCDFLLSDGAAAFVERLDAAAGLFDVKLDMACRRHDMGTSDGRARAVDEMLGVVAQMSNVTKADLLTNAIARRVGADPEAVRRRLAALRKPARRASRTAEEAPAAGPELDPVERGILRCVLASGELVPCVLARASLDDFQDSRIRRILDQCVALHDREGEVDPALLSATLQDRELAGIVADLALSSGSEGKWERELQDCLTRLAARKQRGEHQRLKERAAGADPEAQAALMEHYRELHRRRAARLTGIATE